MTETWKAVPGWEGYYEVSDHGRVRSLRNNHGTPRIRIVRPVPTAQGRYLRVTLSRPGYRRGARLHRLVLLAFRGLPPSPAQNHGAHFNGNGHDCRLENLRWSTAIENEADKMRHGRTNRGERHRSAKLTAETVREIRRLNAEGRSGRELAKHYGLTPAAVSYVVRRRNWKHVA